MEKILKEQREQRVMLSTAVTLLQSMQGVEAGPMSAALPEGTTLPLQTEEGLNLLEESLLDGSVCANMVNYLSVFGGINLADTVRRILNKIMSSQLAVKFNWFGKKGKLAFNKLALASVIFKAVQKTIKQVTHAEVEVVTREWLRTAGDRDGGRKKRRQSAQNPTQDMGAS